MPSDNQPDGDVPPKVNPMDDAGDTSASTSRMDDPESKKNKTSRIPLETAIPSAAQNSAKTPESKTIRLKRPASPSTVKVPRPPTVPDEEEDAQPGLKNMTSRIVLPAPASAEGGAKSETQRIDIPKTAAPAKAAAGQPTRRKTIRIKRPDVPSTVRPVTIARTADEPAPASVQKSAAVKEDEPGVLFLVATIAATILVAVLVYALAVQVFPDAGLNFPVKV